MAIISLTQGKVVIVDDEDFEWLNQWKWLYNGGYAIRSVGPYKNRKHIRMHRLIMDTPDHLEVDHINWDKLDNRRSNLRNVTRSENQRNLSPQGRVARSGSRPGRGGPGRGPGRSGVYGVQWDCQENKWIVKFKVDGKRRRFGGFKLKEEAEQLCREIRAKLQK